MTKSVFSPFSCSSLTTIHLSIYSMHFSSLAMTYAVSCVLKHMYSVSSAYIWYSSWGSTARLDVLTVLRLKYEANHVRGTPDRPTLSDRRVSNMLWSTVSKAALKSSSTKHDDRWLSAAVCRSLWILSNAVSVLWPFLLADCFVSYRLCDCIW